jgi:putative mRNA 3-end processing factor
MKIQLDDCSISLDNSKGDIAFLSHAHSDHLFGTSRVKHLISSKATCDLAKIDKEISSFPNLKMLDAGHILGARQLVIEADGKKIIYSGDFSLKPNIFNLKCEIEECDQLIMEATYGDPKYVFPDLSDVIRQISSFVKSHENKNLIFGSYELGKAQSLIRILNEFGITPIVSKKIDEFCSVYDNHGLKLSRICVGTDEAEEAFNHPFVAIVKMRLANFSFAKKIEEAYNRRTYCAVATGWAEKYRFSSHAAFTLSDHADFNDLVDYVDQTNAKEVSFFCGDGSKVLEKSKCSKMSMILNK